MRITKRKINAAIEQVPDRPLEPEEHPEPIELDEELAYLTFQLDDVAVEVDDDGYVSFVDEEPAFLADIDFDYEFAFGVNITLDDEQGVIENMCELLTSRMPADPGTYIINGEVELAYTIEGIQEFRDYYDFDEYDTSIDTDFADVTYDFRQSNVVNFSFDKL